MDIRKIVPFLTLLVLVDLVKSGDITIGQSNVGKKIYDQTFEAVPAIWRQEQNVTVNATNGEVISGVIVTDLRMDKLGEAAIVDGGEGHNNVTIELKSPTALRGYEFKVQVFAKDGVEKGTTESDSQKLEDPALIEQNKNMSSSEVPFTNLPPAIVAHGSDIKENTGTQNPVEPTDNNKGLKEISTTQSSTAEAGVTSKSTDLNAKDELRQLSSSDVQLNYTDNSKDTSTFPQKMPQDNQQTPTTRQEESTASMVTPKSNETQGEQQNSEKDEEPMINGQGSIYPNVQPTVNGQLIRAERSTNTFKNDNGFTSESTANVNEDTIKFQNIEPNANQEKVQGILGLGPFNVKNEETKNTEAKNLETSLQNDSGMSDDGESPYVHKIPRAKSSDSADTTEASTFENAKEISTDSVTETENGKTDTPREVRATEKLSENDNQPQSELDGKSNLNIDTNEKQMETTHGTKTDLNIDQNKAAKKDEPKSSFVPLIVTRRNSETISTTTKEDLLKKNINSDDKLKDKDNTKNGSTTPKIPVPITSID